MNAPLVSIIIPTFNRAHLIGETLDSIIAQTYPNWECIIVDDGSTDNTEEVVSAYVQKDSRFQFHHRPDSHKPGGNGARNYGFSLSKGEYINWFDSDDILHPNLLNDKINVFINNLETDVVISKSVITKSNIFDIIKFEERTKDSENLVDNFIRLNISWYISDPMWKKTFLLGKSLFSESLLKGQDRDFHTRMLLYEPYIIFLDKHLHYYRNHNDTISNKIDSTTIFSILEHTLERNNLLLNYGIQNETKHFILKQTFKYYKYISKNNTSLKIYRKLIKQLKFRKLKYYKLLLRFTLFIISIKLFNKGEILLK